jgi:hypothetical protein
MNIPSTILQPRKKIQKKNLAKIVNNINENRKKDNITKNRKKDNIRDIIKSQNINSKKVNIEDSFFTDIEESIKNINNSISEIKIDSYINKIKYNNNNSIKLSFADFIKNITTIEGNIKLFNENILSINNYIEEINNKNREIQKIYDEIKISVVGNIQTNVILREGVSPLKMIKDLNIKLLDKLTKYLKQINYANTSFDTKINNLKFEFKEILYNKIVSYYNNLIPKNKINLNITKNNIIPNLIKLTKIIKDGKEYLISINEKISMPLGNGNNYNLENTNLSKITKRINVISELLNNLETDMKDAIKNLKDKTTADITGIKNRIKEKTEKLIQAIRDCISKIKINKNNKNTGLEKIKNDLKVLEGKFTNDLFTNFNSILKENKNVVALEKKLNSILSGMDSLLKNEKVDNNGKNNIDLSESVNSIVTQRLGTEINNSKNQKNNTINFLGKKYRNFKNNNKLIVGQTYLWNSRQKDKYRTGTINSINKNGNPTFTKLTMYQNKEGRDGIEQNGPPQLLKLQGLKSKKLKVPI